MNLIEIIKETGSLPRIAELHDGTKLELFIRRRTGNKGYIATLWQMVNGVQEHIFAYGEGKTPEAAKDDLRNKLIK